MTQPDLQTLLRDYATADEPPFSLQPAAVIACGHRARRNRRVAGAVTAAAVAGCCVALALVMPSLGHRRATTDGSGFAVGSDGASVLQHLENRVRATLDTELPEPDTFVVDHSSEEGSDNGPYPERFSVLYRLDDGHTLSAMAGGIYVAQDIGLDRFCALALADHTAISCTRIPSGPRKRVVTFVSVVGPARPDGSFDVLDARHLTPGGPHLFRRTVRVFDDSWGSLSRTSETVSASDPQTAQGAWTVPVSALRTIADDPALASLDLVR